METVGIYKQHLDLAIQNNTTWMSNSLIYRKYYYDADQINKEDQKQMQQFKIQQESILEGKNSGQKKQNTDKNIQNEKFDIIEFKLTQSVLNLLDNTDK